MMFRRLKCGLLLVLCSFSLAVVGCSSSTVADVVTTLYPEQWTTNQSFGDDCPGTGGLNNGLPVPSSGSAATSDAKAAQVMAGYVDSKIEDCRTNAVYRGAFLFDLPHGVSVSHAILHFRTTSHYEEDFDPYSLPLASGAYSCASSLQIGDADWTTGSFDFDAPLIPSVSFYPLPSGNLSASHDDLSHPSPTAVSVNSVDEAHAGLGTPAGAYFAAEVTGQVNEWSGEDPSKNHGFILVSRNEDLTSTINEGCASVFDGISLEIHSPALFPVDTPLPDKFVPSPTPIRLSTPYPTPTPIRTATPLPVPTATPHPSGTAHLMVSPTQTTAFCLNGQYPPVTVKNTGNGPLQWQVSPSVPITLVPSQGTLAAGISQTVQTSGSLTQPVATVVLSFTSNGGNGTTTFTCK